MSRLRTALTPFDIEQPSSVWDQLIEGIEKNDARKKKDVDKLDLFLKEMCDGYDGDADVGEERERELTSIIAGIFENRRRYRQLKKKELKCKRLLDSRNKTALFGSGSKQPKSRSSGVKKGKRIAGDKSVVSNKRQRADREEQRQDEAIGRPGPSTTVAERMQTRLYEDLMPRTGRQLLTAGDKRDLADKLRRQLEDITNSREKGVLAENYAQEFGDRRIFKYRQRYYVARCPIHHDLQLDYKEAKEHYQSMHMVGSKNKIHHEMMRFFGTRIIGNSAAMEELVRKFCSTPGQEPGNIGAVVSDARSRTPEGGSTSEVARSEIRRATETDRNATSTATPRRNRTTDQDVMPSSETPRDGSRNKPARDALRDTSSEIDNRRYRISWSPTWLSPTREATPVQNEAVLEAGSIRNPLVVLDSQEGASSDAAARSLEAPSPVSVRARRSSSRDTPRPGAKGLKLSPHLTRPRIGAAVAAGPSTVPAPTDAAVRPESQAPELTGAHGDLMDLGLNRDQIQRAAEKLQFLQRGGVPQTRESTSTQQTASPPPSRRASAEPSAGGEATEVDESTGVVNREFTTYGCRKCGTGFILRAFLDQHTKRCTGQS